MEEEPRRSSRGPLASPCSPPPPPKITKDYRRFVEFYFVGIAGKIGHVVTGKIHGQVISMGLPESLVGSQRSVRRCELGTNNDNWKYRSVT